MSIGIFSEDTEHEFVEDSNGITFLMKEGWYAEYRYLMDRTNTIISYESENRARNMYIHENALKKLCPICKENLCYLLASKCNDCIDAEGPEKSSRSTGYSIKNEAGFKTLIGEELNAKEN